MATCTAVLLANTAVPSWKEPGRQLPCVFAGSLLTRSGVFDAGMAGARDPEYTVVPQRQRMAERDGQVRSQVH